MILAVTLLPPAIYRQGRRQWLNLDLGYASKEILHALRVQELVVKVASGQSKIRAGDVPGANDECSLTPSRIKIAKIPTNGEEGRFKILKQLGVE